MTYLLFESPVTLFAAWLPLQFVLIAVWSRRRTPAAGRAVWTGFAAISLLLPLSWVVVTPREKVKQLCHRLVKAVDDGDMAALQNEISPDFEAAGLDRTAFLNRVETTLTRYHVDAPKTGSIDVFFQPGSKATAEFTASAHVHSQNARFDRLASRWRLFVHLTDDHWLLLGLETLPVAPLNLRNLADLIR